MIGTAKPKHVKAGRVLYAVAAFPSSVPGRTQAYITELKVVDRHRAPRWFSRNCDHRAFPCAPFTPVYRFVGMEKELGSKYGFKLGRGGRFLTDLNIGAARATSCHRTFLKLKHALAYQARILSGCWNAREKAYVIYNDQTRMFMGHK